MLQQQKQDYHSNKDSNSKKNTDDNITKEKTGNSIINRPNLSITTSINHDNISYPDHYSHQIDGSTNPNRAVTVKPSPLPYSHLPLSKDMVDQDFIIKKLAEGSDMIQNNNLVISIYDFGGQDVFSALTHFFFTKRAVYLVVFNMEWLLTSLGGNNNGNHLQHMSKDSCIEYLRYWINSIAMHTGKFEESYTSPRDRKVQFTSAPIILVGTHKDVVQDSRYHQYISDILCQEFSNHPVWKNIIFYSDNEKNEDLVFFPIDNTLSREDDVIVKLMKVVEDKIDHSDYVHEMKPLVYFHMIDVINEIGEPYLSTSAIYDLAKSDGMPAEAVPNMLQVRL